MTDRIAKEDIVEVNDAGQHVVVVPAGQPIPDGVDVPKSKSEAATVAVADTEPTTTTTRKSARKRSR